VPPYCRGVEELAWANGSKIAGVARRRDADPGVADLDLEPGLVDADRGRRHPHRDRALGGELDRVRGQVGEHLAQLGGVADQPVADPGRELDRELETALGGPQRQRPQGLADQAARRERDLVELELAGLDLGEVEYVVDQLEQDPGRRSRQPEMLAMLDRVVVAQRQVEHAEDAVQRGPDLVADVGQELGLGAVGALGLIFGQDQPLTRPGQLVASAPGDVVVDHQRGPPELPVELAAHPAALDHPPASAVGHGQRVLDLVGLAAGGR
jgi:hypothetical protein